MWLFLTALFIGQQTVILINNYGYVFIMSLFSNKTKIARSTENNKTMPQCLIVIIM